MSLANKIRILESVVYPTLTHGAQTWSLAKNQLNRIQVTPRKMLKNITGTKLRDKIRNEEVLQQTNSTDIACKIKKLKFEYAGHLYRSEVDNWGKTILDWVTRDQKRAKGRSPRRWNDELRKAVGTPWGRNTYDRKIWKRVVDAYAQRWAE